MKKTIITVIGYDQPGIISSVTDILLKEKCNVENISQTILQSQFAGIFIVLIPENHSPDKLETIFSEKLSIANINIQVKLLEPDRIIAKPKKTDPFILTTTGPDRQGLVAGISKEIADFGINISNLKAVFKGGNNPDQNIMIYEIDIPSDVDYQKFTASIKEKADSLDLDFSIQHKKIFDMINRI